MAGTTITTATVRIRDLFAARSRLTMINAVGGKALNLGIMSSEELPVPGGFCVTTDAYGLVVADQLDDVMGKLADAPDAEFVSGRSRRFLTCTPGEEHHPETSIFVPSFSIRRVETPSR